MSKDRKPETINSAKLSKAKMIAFPLIILIIGALAGLAYSSNAFGVTDVIQEKNPTLDDLFHKWADIYSVDWNLSKAHAIVESALNASAINETDNESLGLMQILCRPDGNGGCINRLNVDGWSEATREKLLDPDFNIMIGTQIIASNVRAYGLPRAIAVYNRFAERNSPVNGPFQNQKYVDRVLKVYKDLTT